MRRSDATARRSWLIVPVSKPAKIEAAARCGADVVVLDLVEFVAERDKTDARREFRMRLGAANAGAAEVFAQVAPGSIGTDLPACVWPGLAGVVLSRVESAAEMEEAACVLDELESERGIAPATLHIVAALETAAGNHAAYDIVRASDRVWGATLGRADLIMDLRPEPSGEIHLMPYLMQRLVIVAGAAGITPIGAWWRAPDRGLLATPEHTYEAARRARAIGFKGAMCLEADQAGALNRGFGAS
jgi:citrate lyase subunit beta/citryl-CoA lyase